MYHIIGLILLLSIYLFSGIHKINDFYNISNDLKTKFQDKFPIDLPIEFYYFTMICVILLLTLGSLMLIYSDIYQFKYNRIVRNTLIALFISFTALATYLYHTPIVGDRVHHVMKNISIVGGFFLLL